MLGATQIDRQIAFLCTGRPVRTPFARTLRVIDSAPWNSRQLTARLRALDIGAVDIRRRGLAGDVDELRRRLRLTGSRRATLVMTRVRDQPWGLVCVEPAGCGRLDPGRRRGAARSPLAMTGQGEGSGAEEIRFTLVLILFLMLSAEFAAAAWPRWSGPASGQVHW